MAKSSGQIWSVGSHSSQPRIRHSLSWSPPTFHPNEQICSIFFMSNLSVVWLAISHVHQPSPGHTLRLLHWSPNWPSQQISPVTCSVLLANPRIPLPLCSLLLFLSALPSIFQLPPNHLLQEALSGWVRLLGYMVLTWYHFLLNSSMPAGWLSDPSFQFLK